MLIPPGLADVTARTPTIELIAMAKFLRTCDRDVRLLQLAYEIELASRLTPEEMELEMKGDEQDVGTY